MPWEEYEWLLLLLAVCYKMVVEWTGKGGPFSFAFRGRSLQTPKGELKGGEQNKERYSKKETSMIAPPTNGTYSPEAKQYFAEHTGVQKKALYEGVLLEDSSREERLGEGEKYF